MITKGQISKTVAGLLKRAVSTLPEDVESALEKARRTEGDKTARMQLEMMLDNVKCAREGCVPMCQDTGIAVVYVGLGSKAPIDSATLEEAVIAGIRAATKRIPLRSNAVHPLTRKNSGDNTGPGVPVIEIDILKDKDYVEITVLPKGAGSENMSRLCMLKPSEGINGIKRFVLESVASAGGNPCPPVVVGVGIGGTADKAMRLSKKALLRKIQSRNGDGDMAGLECELLEDINRLGIGPMGLGGCTSALAVHIEYAYCHTASLPVAVNLQCWANRRASARITEEGTVFL